MKKIIDRRNVDMVEKLFAKDIAQGIRGARGFTLAEVLITLGIIGIVAAMTIPTLIAKNKLRVTRTKLAHTYSILSQAYKLAYNEYGDPTGWGLYNNSVGYTNFANHLIPFMKVVNDCGITANSTKGMVCWANSKMKYCNGALFNGNTWNLARYSGFYKLVLIDGTALAFTTRSENCTAKNGDKSTYCGYILADIDGPNKGKNQLGDDVFQFIITDKGIFPQGGPNIHNNDNAIGEGWGATWWVLHNNNMDYLKCPTKLNFNKIRCN